MIARPFHSPARTLPAPPIHCWFPEPALVSPLEPPEHGAPAEDTDWEAACILETQNGRPEAFNPLVAHYAPRIRAYLYRMVRNHEEAEDLTQEAFLKAFRALPRFQAGRPFKRWLYTIATNTGLNALRSRKRKGTPVDLDTDLLPAGGPVPAPHGDGRVERLEAALASLSPRAARLVALHYQEGFTLQEAGDVLGMTESAAKVALFRARKQLRKTMLHGDER